MRYRLEAGADVEASSNRDAMRRLGEKLLHLATEDENSEPPPERLVTSDIHMNYWVQVSPEKV